jgi:hypothetical protein
MELPGILKEALMGPGQGMIELCPDEYDIGKVGEMLEDVLAQCEEMVLDRNGSVTQSTSD